MTDKPAALYWLSNPMERDLVRLVLIRAGFDPLGCTDLDDLNQGLSDQNIKLLILDVVLPGLNGLEIMKNIKADRSTANIMVILVSSLAFQDVIVQARKAGAADFFVKPLNGDLLFKRLVQLVKNPLSVG